MVIGGPEVAGVHHGAPFQAGLGGQGGEGDVGQVRLTHGDGVPLVLGGEQGAVGVGPALDGAAGEFLHGVGEGVHGSGVAVAGDGDGGEDQLGGGVAGGVIIAGLFHRNVGVVLGDLKVLGQGGNAGQHHQGSQQQGKQLFHCELPP